MKRDGDEKLIVEHLMDASATVFVTKIQGRVLTVERTPYYVRTRRLASQSRDGMSSPYTADHGSDQTSLLDGNCLSKTSR